MQEGVVGRSSGVGRGERLELDEDLDPNGVYLAWDRGSVCARWKPFGVRVGAWSQDLSSSRLAVVLSSRVPNWVHRALD